MPLTVASKNWTLGLYWLGDISASKLWRPWSDITNCGIRSGSTLFAYGQKLDSGLILIGTGWYFCKQTVDPDQTPLIVASALGLHYYIQEMDSGLILVRYKLLFLQENCGDPDQTSLTMASTLGLHNLPRAKSWTLGLYWLGTSWYFCKQIMKILIRCL